MRRPAHELPLTVKPHTLPKRSARALRGYVASGPRPFALSAREPDGGGRGEVLFPPVPLGNSYPPSRPNTSHGTLRAWLERREDSLSAKLGRAGTAPAAAAPGGRRGALSQTPLGATCTGPLELRDSAVSSRALRAATPRGATPRLPGTPLAAAGVLQGAPAEPSGPLRSYRWLPVQVHAEAKDAGSEYFLGTFVSTLTLDLQVAAPWEAIGLEPGGFRPQGRLECCLVAGAVVLCRGLAVGACPQEHDPQRGRNAVVGRLPEGLRPRVQLQFAALCEELQDAQGRPAADGHSAYRPHLVALFVAPDGWIRAAGLRGTLGAVDLSAVRFSTGRGVAVTDAVRVHTCDLASRRLVVLQGTLSERLFESFAACEHKASRPLLPLPQNCRPAARLPFVVAGGRSGGFHLLRTEPGAAFGFGGGLAWCDSTWYRDSISLSGLLFEAAPEALEISAGLQDWTPARRLVVVRDFQRLLRRRHGSLEAAWCQAFDVDGSGHIDFAEFMAGCKSCGFIGNVTRLWAMLDEDGSGEISMAELSADTDAMERQLAGESRGSGGGCG